jgi:hypothetical protein
LPQPISKYQNIKISEINLNEKCCKSIKNFETAFNNHGPYIEIEE